MTDFMLLTLDEVIKRLQSNTESIQEYETAIQKGVDQLKSDEYWVKLENPIQTVFEDAVTLLGRSEDEITAVVSEIQEKRVESYHIKRLERLAERSKKLYTRFGRAEAKNVILDSVRNLDELDARHALYRKRGKRITDSGVEYLVDVHADYDNPDFSTVDSLFGKGKDITYTISLELSGLAERLSDFEGSKTKSSKKTGRKRLTEEEWNERATEVKKVLAIKKKHRITEEQACARDGLPYETFRTWKRETKNRGLLD